MLRIISTYVENTFKQDGAQQGEVYHLHIRGEYIDLVDTRQMYVGSSPHTWRIPEQKTAARNQVRIISTYVENTSSSLQH